MVGRDRELQRGLDAAGRDGCVGVVIVGPAGVGKSALATAIATRSRAPGGEVLRITATESASSISLGAVAPLLSAPSAPTTQADMIRHTVTALVERAGTGRLVVVVDDAHQLDGASATLVHQLALTGAAFVVATLRSQEPVPDPVTALWKDGRAERMDLTELGLAESTVLAQSILGHPLHPTAASTLFNASAGNPLFLQQLVASARDVGVLELVAGRGPVAGGWRLTGPLPLPSDLISAVESRLQHLSDEDRSVLELLALGDPLGAAVLEDLAGPDAQARLERLEADGFILAELVRRRLDVRLAHPMYGEVLRAGMPHSWASRARMMLADAVTALGARRRDDALRIAVWRLEARAPIPSAIAHAAAELALLRFDPQLAARIVRQSDGGRADGAAATNAMAPDDVFLLALIAARSAQPDDALEQLDRLDELLDSIEHDGHLRAKAMVLRFDVLTYIKGHFEAAFALELPDDSDRSDGAGLAARKAVVLITLGRPTFAAAVLAPLEGAPLSRHADVWVSLARAMTAASLGQVEEAMTTIARCEAGFAAIGWDPGLPDPAIVSFVRLRILQQEGRLDEACALAVRGIDFERDRWSEQGVAWNRMASSSIHRVRGHPLLAADEARASAAVFERVGSYQLAGVALAELAAAAATAGDRDGAAAAAQQCDDLGVANFYGRCAHAWAIVGAGRITDGVARLVEV
ncbi:MAG: transcriptional regulator, LuxR family, partial [Ilumatobacteraceae bacterium]|nr:transcriptional regulator, LuxR family [Ilumatobacteraceae bacterium]